MPTRYVPSRQNPQPAATFEVRTAGDPLAAIADIREAVRQVDPNLPLMNVSTQLAEIERRFQQEKMFAQAYTLFGVMSYSVARRTNEIGVRMALGARVQDILQTIMQESMMVVAIGVAIGIGGAIAVSRLVSSLLFGLAPNDPATLAAAMAVLILISAIAGYLPARRASRVDPLVALRDE